MALTAMVASVRVSRYYGRARERELGSRSVGVFNLSLATYLLIGPPPAASNVYCGLVKLYRTKKGKTNTHQGEHVAVRILADHIHTQRSTQSSHF